MHTRRDLQRAAGRRRALLDRRVVVDRRGPRCASLAFFGGALPPATAAAAVPYGGTLIAGEQQPGRHRYWRHAPRQPARGSTRARARRDGWLRILDGINAHQRFGSHRPDLPEGLPGYGSNMRWFARTPAGAVAFGHADYARCGLQLTRRDARGARRHGVVPPVATSPNEALQTCHGGAHRPRQRLVRPSRRSAPRGQVASDESYERRTGAAARRGRRRPRPQHWSRSMPRSTLTRTAIAQPASSQCVLVRVVAARELVSRRVTITAE